MGSALATIITAAVVDGKPGLKDLLGRMVRWRVGTRWYAIALGLSVVLTLAPASIYLLLGEPTALRCGKLSILESILVVLVVAVGPGLSRSPPSTTILP